MMRALFYATLALALTACIDNRLSLGSHEAPPSGDGDGDGDGDGVTPPPGMDAALMPPMTGGFGGMTGGSPYVPAPDAAEPDPDADVEPPRPSPCSDRITMNATLSCQVDNGGFGGRPESMTTTSTLTFEPDLRSGRQGQGRVSGLLSFEAFNATFNGRIDAGIDCELGTLRGRILDGQISMDGVPPSSARSTACSIPSAA
jgi:hypothetical protein